MLFSILPRTYLNNAIVAACAIVCVSPAAKGCNPFLADIVCSLLITHLLAYIYNDIQMGVWCSNPWAFQQQKSKMAAKIYLLSSIQPDKSQT